MKQEYILCSAIHYLDGKKHEQQPENITTGFVVAGWRHSNCIYTFCIIVTGESDNKAIQSFQSPKSIQGFITSKNRFLNREESYILAVKTGQIQDNSSTKHLISEDLW